ncbi:MAG: glycosyltransferase family 2 protein [Anaerostipes sp.]|nr:glycosyltransferase family 2 protein [Anaerostipes sp.]
MKKSVIIAYYNGIKYINEQVGSILKQLDKDDELIISVDGWEDGSKELLFKLRENDSRIKIVAGPHQGVAKNFEQGLGYCNGDIIFIADQDDVWEDNKVEKVCEAFEDPRVTAVVHNAMIVDGNLEDSGTTTFQWRESKAGFWKNMKRNSYIGCCMAVKRGVLKSVLPIPEYIWIHDQWIGLLCEQLGKVIFLDDVLLKYRRHENNVTGLNHGHAIAMLKKRIFMIFGINRRVKEWEKEDAENQTIL